MIDARTVQLSERVRYARNMALADVGFISAALGFAAIIMNWFQ